MKQIVECVPNFSEGRNQIVIDQIVAEITNCDGVKLLDVDPGRDTNRTVVTFVGEPAQVIEAAFLAIRKASQLIDMAKHAGAHPRMGATDVCPLIPVSGISKKDCVAYAKKLAEHVGKELSIPVYLYGVAATKPEREKLPDIRAGEYEALPAKLKKSAWKPDYGPAKFNAKSGATVIGVRDFLLAYNINLNTDKTALANTIAKNIRTSGKAKRDEAGKIVRNPDGTAVKIPGSLPACQGTGWYVEDYGRAQVSVNLLDYKVTGLHTVFDEVCKEADTLGLRVTGSELVGLVPREALLDAGKYFLRKQGRMIGLSEEQIVHTAILSLGLDDVAPFDPKEKVIEYAIEERKEGLVDLTVEQFVNELASDSPAPGGGSVSALSGALSAGLAAMVAQLTYGKKDYEQYDDEMEQISLRAQELKREYGQLIDADTLAFNGFLAAMRLPKKSDEDKQKRSKAMQTAAIDMTEVPFQTLQLSRQLCELADVLVQKGNMNALSDAGVAAMQAETAAEGAWMNVMINLPSIKDKRVAKKYREKADEILDEVKKARRKVVARARKALVE